MLKFNIVKEDGSKGVVVVNEDLARNILRIVDQGLVNGIGHGTPGDMCVEAAVAFASGEGRDNDQPTCVAPYIRNEKIALNDEDGWDGDLARAKGLRRLAIAQLGTAKGFNVKKYEAAVIEATKEYMLAKANNLANFMSLDSNVFEDLTPEPTGQDEVLKWTEAFNGVATNQALVDTAEIMVQALIKIKAPGTKYLYLTEKGKKKAPAKKAKRKVAKKRKG